VSFSGCAKTNLDYNKLRNNKRNIVKTLDSLKPYTLEINKEFIVHLGEEHKEIIMIEKQKVFASKLLFSRMDTPFSLDIKSFSTAGFFAPRIYFLNNENKIIKQVGAKDLLFDRGFFKGTIFINTEYSKIYSIVVMQDIKESQREHKINYVTTTPVIIPIGPYVMTYTTSSGDQNKTIQNAYGGSIKLILKRYSPRVVVK
jgi:hypothetical protein